MVLEGLWGQLSDVGWARDGIARLAQGLQDPQVLQFCAENIEKMDGKAELELSPFSDSTNSPFAATMASPKSPMASRSTESMTSPLEPAASPPAGSIFSSNTLIGTPELEGIGVRQDSSQSTLAVRSRAQTKDESVEKIKPTLSPISTRGIGSTVSKAPDKSSCLENCACKCHAQSFQWPNGLQGKTGRLFYESVPRFTRQCSDRRCRAGKIRSKVSFVYPSSMIKKVVSVLIFSRGMKVKVQLKNRRLQSAHAPVNQYILSGDLNGVMKCIENGDATPSDVLSDGWTLTHTAAYRGHLEIVQYLLKMGADTTIGEVGAR